MSAFCALKDRMHIPSLFATGLLLLVASTAFAGSAQKIYLDPDDGFSAYFSSAIQKKKVPVTVTTDPAQADYTAQF